MFRAVPLSIIRSLFAVHSALIYVIQVCRQLSSRVVCRVLRQNKFEKLVHLVGFIIKKFVTMQHGHMKVKKKEFMCCLFMSVSYNFQLRQPSCVFSD
jgi:hypothetical protein